MNSADRKTIDGIILINKYIPTLQEKIEKEQKRVIGDMVAPARKTVDALIALDNRRIDLCNLNVLYGFIERKLGERFCVLETCAAAHAASGLYDLAAEAMGECGYDAQRARDEFNYLFKQLKASPRIKGHAVAVVGSLRTRA